MAKKKILSKNEQTELLNILKARFENNKDRHEGIEWKHVLEKLEGHPSKLWSFRANGTNWR